MLDHLYRLMRRSDSSGQAERRTGADAAEATVSPATEGPFEAPSAGTPLLDDPGLLESAFLSFVFEAPPGVADTAGLFALVRLQEAASGERFDVRRLPRLPAVVPPLLKALRSDEVSFDQVARLLARDPVLVGEAVRVANSPWYRRGDAVGSLPQAVRLLGQEGLRQVVLTVAMRPLHPAEPGSLEYRATERMWEHAQRCAVACVALASGSGCNPFEAQLAGIVSATGANALIRLLLHEEYSPATLTSPDLRAHFLEHAWRVSEQAARYWDFPAAVLVALAERAQGCAASPLGAALLAADRVVMLQLLQANALVSPDLRWTGHAGSPALNEVLERLHRQFVPVPADPGAPDEDAPIADA